MKPFIFKDLPREANRLIHEHLKRREFAVSYDWYYSRPGWIHF